MYNTQVTPPELRVLGRIRLSKDANEAGTSIERQRESIEQWAKMHGHRVVGWAVDSGVSGSVDPFDTPELGPWLHEPRLREWDALVAYRLDRLSRRVIPLNKLFGFVQNHDKTLASVSESLDLSTWIGRLVANVIAGVAEGELEAIRERNIGSQKTVREKGRWHGGTTPYGYRSEKRQDGWYLVVDLEERRVIREVVLPMLRGQQSTRSIARHLNETGIPSRKGGTWSTQALKQILQRRSLLGQHEHSGKVFCDEDGLPQLRAEPILSAPEYEEVQHLLSARSVRSSPSNANPLAGVLFCHRCDGAMYQQHNKPGYIYFRCVNRSRTCDSKSLRAEDVLTLVEESFLAAAGPLDRREKVFIPGSDHTEALAAVVTAIETVRKEKDLGLYDGDDAGYFSRLSRLTSRRQELEALPATTAGFEMKLLGETYAQAWERMDWSERRTMLRDAQITVSLSAGPGKALQGGLELPADVRNQIEQGNDMQTAL